MGGPFLHQYLIPLHIVVTAGFAGDDGGRIGFGKALSGGG